MPFRESGELPARGIHVTLGDAQRPTTLTTEVMAALSERLREWESRNGLRWIAFTSAHPTTFLAGAHMDELGALSPLEAPPFARMGQELFRRFRESPLWLTGCIDGACMGGGLDFVLSLDYRIATTRARFSHPGPRLGILTGWGGTVTLPRRSGGGFTALLHGEVLDAENALASRWIEEIAPDPLEKALLRARASESLDLSFLKSLNQIHCILIIKILE